MTRHAIERIQERYGKEFTQDDMNILCAILKKGTYLEIVQDFMPKDKITILIRYNNIPLKLVYMPKENKVITALPLDVDEYNDYYDLVPSIDTKAKGNDNNEDIQHYINIFKCKFKDKEFYQNFQLDNYISQNAKIYIKNINSQYIILWCELTKGSINFSLFSKKNLKRKLWHLIIKAFRKNNTIILKNTILLYAKIYK